MHVRREPSDRLICAPTSARMGEDLAATASQNARWLLVECGGSWGRRAVEESRLTEAEVAAVTAAAEALDARAVLVRRPHHRLARGRAWLCDTRDPAPWLVQLPIADVPDLAALAAATDGGPPPGSTPAGPMVLVCTNGKHDPCCATLGRPVVRALRRSHADVVWEVSHIGGDRFAPNVLCLPHGVYLARVDPDEAVTVVDAYLDGRISLPHYRGRTSLPVVRQAAEIYARRELGLDGLADVAVRGVTRRAERTWLVDLLAGGAERGVVVTRLPDAEPPRQLMCSGPPAKPRVLDCVWA